MNLQNFSIYTINYWFVLPTVLFLVLLSFLEKRKSHQDVCDGRPALIIPFSFLDGFDNRTAYAMAFGTITSTITSLVTSRNTLGLRFPLWGQALYSYIDAFIACLTCFSLFACLSTRYRAVGNVICIIYSAVWLNLNIVNTMTEVEEIKHVNESNYTQWLKDLGILEELELLELKKARVLLQGLPPIFCQVILIAYCTDVLRRCVMSRVFVDNSIPGAAQPHQQLHVKWVFSKSKDVTIKKGSFILNKTFVELMRDSVELKLLTNFPFFKYPTRIVAGVFVLVLIVYWLGVMFICDTIQGLYYAFSFINDLSPLIKFEAHYFTAVRIVAVISLVVSISNAALHIFLFTRNYRYHMMKIYQGDKSFVRSAATSSPQYILTSGMIYPGYQIAFMMWGLAISFGFTLILGIALVEVYFTLKRFGYLEKVLRKLGELMVFPVILVFVFCAQVFISKNFFLQDKLNYYDKHKPLNVNNRKLYELVSYYSLFANMAVGLFTCFLRIVLNAFFGIFFVDRLDKSFFTRDMEKLDSGYMAYISMLSVDNAHNNPSMRVFAHFLWMRGMAFRCKVKLTGRDCRDDSDLNSAWASQIDNCWAKPDSAEYAGDHQNGVAGYTGAQASGDFKNFTFTTPAKIRWFLAYTLLHNPQLIRLRKNALPQRPHETVNSGTDCRVELPRSDLLEKSEQQSGIASHITEDSQQLASVDGSQV